jgi:hypothetical protein
MPYYHQESGLVYLGTPRTGSRATKEALTDIGFERVGAHHGCLGLLRGQAASVATTVRDPKEILASWVRRNIKPSMTPEEIVRQEIETNEWVIDGKCASLHLPDATETLRYEKGLQFEVNRWLTDHGLPEVRLPQKGSSKGKDREVTQRQWQIIKDYTRDERVKLGYI